MHTLNRVSSNHMRDTYSRGNFELHLIRVSIHVTRKNGYDQFYSKHVSWETSTGTRVFTNKTTSWRQRRRRRRRRKQPQRQQATTAATTATATTSTTTIKLLRNDGTIDDTSNNQLAARHSYIGFLFCFTRLDDNLLTRRRIPISLHLRRQSSSFLFFLNGWLLFLLCFVVVDDFVDRLSVRFPRWKRVSRGWRGVRLVKSFLGLLWKRFHVFTAAWGLMTEAVTSVSKLGKPLPKFG